MPFKEQKFKYDVTTLKIIGCGNHKKILLTYNNCVRRKHLEGVSDEKNISDDDNEYSKFNESIIRSKRVVRELSLCNPWDYFCTMTIDSKKYNRTDLNTFFKHFRKYINNLNRKDDFSISYLLFCKNFFIN